MPKIMESIKEELDNKIYMVLVIGAFFSMITGFFSQDGFFGWMQGVSIIVGLLILVGFGATNDWIKDSRFVKLQEWYKKGRIGVVRGKRGMTQTVSIYSLVVGDIIVLEPGCIIPADCLLLEGEDIEVDETPLGKDSGVSKHVINSTDDQSNDPFLFSGSILNKGSGKALVCVVGDDSRRP